MEGTRLKLGTGEKKATYFSFLKQGEQYKVFICIIYIESI